MLKTHKLQEAISHFDSAQCPVEKCFRALSGVEVRNKRTSKLTS